MKEKHPRPPSLSSWASSCKASQAFVEVSSPGSEHCSDKNSWMLETHRYLFGGIQATSDAIL